MVEVYHSARLHCAASHELMMKAGRDGERGQTAAGGVGGGGVGGSNGGTDRRTKAASHR